MVYKVFLFKKIPIIVPSLLSQPGLILDPLIMLKFILHMRIALGWHSKLFYSYFYSYSAVYSSEHYQENVCFELQELGKHAY